MSYPFYYVLRSAGRWLVPKPLRPALINEFMRYWADAIIISFPKCGRTWIAVMLGEYLRLHFKLPEVELLEIHRLGLKYNQVPLVWFSHDDQPQRKTPEELTKSKIYYRNSRIVFLVRDPRDVAVSMFFHKLHRSRDFNGSIHDYLHQPRGGIEVIVTFFNLWIAQQHIPKDFLLIHYRDIHADPAGVLCNLLKFIDIAAPVPEFVEKAVELGRFQSMRDMEEKNVLRNRRLSTPPGSPKEAFKTREGIIGGYRQHLSMEDIEFIDNYVNHHLDPRFGYRTDAGVITTQKQEGYSILRGN